jgi:rhodanese-related sulfurtransferase
MSGENWQYITTEEVQKLLRENKEIQLIDVREEDEYEEGHIKGAKLVPLSNFRAGYEKIDPDKEAILLCHSGARSTNACNFLASLGYSKLKNMKGGMMNWRGPVEK